MIEDMTSETTICLFGDSNNSFSKIRTQKGICLEPEIIDWMIEIMEE